MAKPKMKNKINYHSLFHDIEGRPLFRMNPLCYKFISGRHIFGRFVFADEKDYDAMKALHGVVAKKKTS
jgi:hypothetical protein